MSTNDLNDDEKATYLIGLAVRRQLEQAPLTSETRKEIEAVFAWIEQNPMSPSDPSEGGKLEAAGRRLFVWITAVSIAFIAGVGIIYSLYKLISTETASGDSEYMNIVKEHYPFMIGIPSAAAAAIFVVLLMRSASGNIEIEIPEVIRFKGAAAPILFWILCFLAMIAAIKMLW